MKITFWGVRGSLPVPGPNTVVYGGNTSCVQVQIGERTVIFDAGSGIYPLGQELIRQGKPLHLDIFISHVHWDHIHGFPFFTPAFFSGNQLTLYGQTKSDRSFEDCIRQQMAAPFFPITMEQFRAKIEFQELKGKQTIDLGSGLLVYCAPVRHPNGSLSYRVEHEGKSCCYITDVEHDNRSIDTNLLELVQGADVVIYDAMFSDEEYYGLDGKIGKQGWGHSTWQEGVRLARAAGVKKLVLFHHATYRTDEEMAEYEANARQEYADCVAAREGMVIEL